jgi:hypothetical protein
VKSLNAEERSGTGTSASTTCWAASRDSDMAGDGGEREREAVKDASDCQGTDIWLTALTVRQHINETVYGRHWDARTRNRHQPDTQSGQQRYLCRFHADLLGHPNLASPGSARISQIPGGRVKDERQGGSALLIAGPH